jgi:hypothetical protein
MKGLHALCRPAICCAAPWAICSETFPRLSLFGIGIFERSAKWMSNDDGAREAKSFYVVGQ